MRLPTKAFWHSKMFWLGAAEISGGILLLASEEIQNSITAGEPIGWISIVKGAVTIILRYTTSMPISLTGEGTKEVAP